MDIISYLAIGILVGWTAVLVGVQGASPDAGPVPKRVLQATWHNNNPEMEKKIELAENLLINNQQQAEQLISSLIAEFSYNGMPYMLAGDLFLYRQQPIQAMHSYRQAVDLNLDFLDKKTPLYQGKKIRNVVNEAEEAINKTLSKQKGDPIMRKLKKEVYYMKRRLAGSCGN
jgi:hypothetical protein